MTNSDSERQHAKANAQTQREHDSAVQKQPDVPSTKPVSERPIPQGPENPDTQSKVGHA